MKKRCRLKSRLSVILLCCFVIMIPARIYAAPSASAAEGAVSHPLFILPEYVVPHTLFGLPEYVVPHTLLGLPEYVVPHTLFELPEYTSAHTSFESSAYAAPNLPDIQLPEIPENIKIPKIHIEPEAEKEKLREALKTMDELGISPGKLLQRFRDFVGRKKKRDKAEDQAEDKAENTARGGTGELDRVRNKIREEAEQQIDKAADQAKRKIGEAAEKQIDQAVDQAKENIKQEIDQK